MKQTKGAWVLGAALAAVAGIALLGGCAKPPPPAALEAPAKPDAAAELEAFKVAIRAQYDLKEKAFAEHDAETILSRFYAADAISVGEGEGIFIGREQMRPLYLEVVKAATVKIESKHTYVKGDAGWDWVDFHVTINDGKTAPFTFAMIFLWAREDGQWMSKGDMFVNGSFASGKVGSAPVAAPKP